MFKWFKEMRRKQKESDRILEEYIQKKRTKVEDSKTRLRNHALSLAVNYRRNLEGIKIDYNLSDEDLDAYVGVSEQ